MPSKPFQDSRARQQRHRNTESALPFVRLAISPRALLRLREIQAYIAPGNATAAAMAVSRIRQTAQMVADHPMPEEDWDGSTRALTVSGLPWGIIYDSAQRVLDFAAPAIKWAIVLLA